MLFSQQKSHVMKWPHKDTIKFSQSRQVDLAYMITDFGIGELRLVRCHVLGDE